MKWQMYLCLYSLLYIYTIYYILYTVYIYLHQEKYHWILLDTYITLYMHKKSTRMYYDNQLDDPLSPLAIPVENLGKRILAGWQSALIHHFFIQTSHHTQSSAPGPSSSTCIHGLRSCAPFPTHTPSDSQQDKVMTTSNNCHTPPLAGPATLLRDTWSTGSRNTSISPWFPALETSRTVGHSMGTTHRDSEISITAEKILRVDEQIQPTTVRNGSVKQLGSQKSCTSW